MKAKKVLIILLGVISITCAALGLTACDSCTESHTHTYSEAWSYDATYHWHDATCGHDEVDGYEEHSYNSDGVCTVCGYDSSHTITISFNTLGGSDIDPITIEAGASILDKLPSTAVKDGVRFDQWYLDEALTQPLLSSSTYSFNEDTTLYAGYTASTVDEEIEYGDIDESTLLDQPADVKLYIAGNGGALSTSTLSKYLTVENQNEIYGTPDFTITTGTSAAGISCYVLSAEWEKGSIFTFTLAEPFKFLVTLTEFSVEYETEVSVLNLFLEAGEDYTNIVENDGVVTVTTDDYVALSDAEIYLRKDFAYDNNLQDGSIIKLYLNDDGSDYCYCALASVKNTAVGTTEVVYATLEEPEVDAVFDTLDFSITEDFDVCDAIEEDLDEDAIVKSLMANDGIYTFLDYGIVSALDYANYLGISADGAVLTNGTKLLLDESSSGSKLVSYTSLTPTVTVTQREVEQVYPADTVVKMYIVYFGWTIPFSSSTYANVSFCVMFGGTFHASSSGSLFKFSVFVGMECYSYFSYDITITHNGVNYDATKDVRYASYSIDALTQRYKTLLNLDSSYEISIDLFEKYISVKCIDISIPVSIKVRFSLNGAFSASSTYIFYKTFGIKGGLFASPAAYNAELYNYQKVENYYEGKFGIRMGFTIGIRFSVFNLFNVACVGFDLGTGLYFNYYGYGYSINESYMLKTKSLSNDEHWNLLKDNDYYATVEESSYTEKGGSSYMEVGIYFTLELVAESRIFNLSVGFTALDIEIKIYGWGDQYLIVDFGEDLLAVEDESFIMDQYGIIDLYDYNINVFQAMDLKTGDIKSYTLNSSQSKYLKVYWSLSYRDGTIITGEGTTITAPEDVISGEKQAAYLVVLVAYNGTNMYGKPDGGYMMLNLYGAFNYVKPDPYEGVEYHTVTLMLADEEFMTVEVHEGTSVYYELIEFQEKSLDELTVTLEWLNDNMDYSAAGFYVSDLQKTITEDTVINGYLVPRAVKINYFYSEIKSDNTMATTYGSINADAGTDIYDALAAIDVSTVLPNENYTFTGWDIGDLEDTTLHYGVGASYKVYATYEAQDITITVVVKPDELSGYNYGISGTFTYTVTAGSNALMVNDHVQKSSNYVTEIIFPDGYDSLYDSYYTDVTFTLEWKLNNYWAYFYDYRGAFLIMKYITVYENNIGILSDEDVLEAAGETYYELDNDVRYEFSGWTGSENLYYVTSDVYLYAVYERATRTITLDANGGALYYNGYYYATTFTTNNLYGGDPSDVVGMITAKRDGTESTAYTFNGWYYIDENGEKVYGLETMYENRTYYADWAETENDVTVHIYASNYSYVSGGSSGAVAGEFADGSALIEKTMKYSEYLEFMQTFNTDSCEIESPTATTECDGGSYYFLSWWVNGNYVYARYNIRSGGSGAVYVYLSFDIGQGTNTYYTGAYERRQLTSYRTDDDGNNVYDEDGNYLYMITIEEWHQPKEGTGGEGSNIRAYEDEAYYYRFDYWNVSINGGETVKYATGDKIYVEADDYISITAVYYTTAKVFTYTFKVYTVDEDGNSVRTYDAAGNYIQRVYYDNSKGVTSYTLHTDFYVTLYLNYGTVLTEENLPTAQYDLYNTDYVNRLWEYVLDYWLNEDTGDRGVDMTVTGNRSYKAYFTKATLYYDVTFNAGAGAFADGSSTKTITVASGTSYEVAIGMLGETPLRDGSVYEFWRWQYSAYSSIISDETLYCSYWNTEKNCQEGYEDYVYIYLDAGYGNVMEWSGERFYELYLRIGETLDLEILDNYMVEIDGAYYVATWDIEDGTAVTADMNGLIITYTALTLYE